MNIFLAGPMSNCPYFNFPAFSKATQTLRSHGYSVYSPAERDVIKYGTDWYNSKYGNYEEVAHLKFSLRDAFAAGTEFICKHADGIALLPGWKDSVGSQAEYALAKALNLVVMELYIDNQGEYRW